MQIFEYHVSIISLHDQISRQTYVQDECFETIIDKKSGKIYIFVHHHKNNP